MKGVGGVKFGPLASVVQTLDSSIHRISITGNNCIIRWIEIYRVDSAIQRLNNRDLVNGI